MAFGKNKAPRLKENKLPFFKFLAWKSSDITQAGAFLIVNTYLTLFCSDFLGMSPAVVGTILLVSNIIDAITDLVAAYVIDNSKSKWGKGRPYELGIIGVTICTTLMFCANDEWSMGLKIAWIFFMYTFVFGVFGTFRNIAMTPYLIRAFSNNRTVIGKVASYGGLVTTLGSMVVSRTFPQMMAKLATSAEGWRNLLLIYMIPLTLIAVLRVIFVKEDPSVDAGNLTEKVTLKDILTMMKKNGYAWFYFGIMFLFNVITSLGALSYYFKYIVGDVSMAGILSIFGTLMLPLMFIFPLLMKKFSAAQLIGFGGIVASLGYLMNFFAGANIGMLIGATLLTTLASLPISYLQSLIVMDLCSYNQRLGLQRMDASVSSIFGNLSTQLGQGIGGFVMGIGLSIAGYVTAQGDAVVAQPDSAIFMIRAMYSLVPMVLMILLVICAMNLGKLKKLLETTSEEETAK